jgi:hypothetical protein
MPDAGALLETTLKEEKGSRFGFNRAAKSIVNVEAEQNL